MFRMSFPPTKGARFGIAQVLLYCVGFLLGMFLLVLLGFYSSNLRGGLFAFGAVLIGFIFILGAFIDALTSNPDYQGAFKKVGAWIGKYARWLLGLVMLGLATLIGFFLLANWDSGFMNKHRYELFWLVALPALMASPVVIGYLASRFSSKGN